MTPASIIKSTIIRWTATKNSFARLGWAALYVGWMAAQAAGAEGCASCHDQAAKLEKSAHASLSCDTCHESHEKYPHPKNAAKPECGACHESVASDYNRSVHGQAVARGVAQAPLCTDCHGEHSIQKHTNPASPVSAGRVTETCGSCHGNVRLSERFGMPADRLVSFEASFHGLAAKSGNQTVANCASCHGVHNILASSDSKSTVNPKNLAQTCGKCHAGAGQRFAITPVHIVANRAEPAAVRWVRLIYLILIPVVIGLMLLHNAGDWLRKVALLRFSAGKNPTPAAGPELRMLGFERAQHAVLVISFLVLAWTGFALKYPDQWWASPLLLWESRWPVRSWIHRGAAVALILVSLAHALSLIVSPRLRLHWKELWPRRDDAIEAVENMAYNLGMRRTRPYRSAHSYIEKAEYWAVVWGAVVMALTGLMLWANNLMLALLPKSWLDVATGVHFYEAVLATLAIVVWHFYSVIFDPDVYPMDTAWFSGFSSRLRRWPGSKPPEKKEPAG